MENLLSLAFDNISSSVPDKIRKGLRQIEGLLAQMCLSTASRKSSALKPGHRRHASALPSANTPSQNETKPKSLAELPSDPAFREFFRLQDGFEWNVATRLVACLERLLGMPGGASNDGLILSAITLLQGTLLLHPPSRKIFEREIYTNILLDLLDTSIPPSIQSATLSTLLSALLSSPQNIRAFEAADGLLTITSLYKSRGTTSPVRATLDEFLFFYLLPEDARRRDPVSEPNTGVWSRGPGERRADTVGEGAGWGPAGEVLGWGASGGAEEGEVKVRSVEEKRRLLGRYLKDVDGIMCGFKATPPIAGLRGGGAIRVE